MCFFQSFNLRHAKTEKHDRLHSVVSNINVAAILEKANAIRQVKKSQEESSSLYKNES